MQTKIRFAELSGSTVAGVFGSTGSCLFSASGVGLAVSAACSLLAFFSDTKLSTGTLVLCFASSMVSDFSCSWFCWIGVLELAWVASCCGSLFPDPDAGSSQTKGSSSLESDSSPSSSFQFSSSSASSSRVLSESKKYADQTKDGMHELIGTNKRPIFDCVHKWGHASYIACQI